VNSTQSSGRPGDYNESGRNKGLKKGQLTFVLYIPSSWGSILVFISELDINFRHIWWGLQPIRKKQGKKNHRLTFVLYRTSSWDSICAFTRVLLLGGINRITTKGF